MRYSKKKNMIEWSVNLESDKAVKDGGRFAWGVKAGGVPMVVGLGRIEPRHVTLTTVGK